MTNTKVLTLVRGHLRQCWPLSVAALTGLHLQHVLLKFPLHLSPHLPPPELCFQFATQLIEVPLAATPSAQGVQPVPCHHLLAVPAQLPGRSGASADPGLGGPRERCALPGTCTVWHHWPPTSRQGTGCPQRARLPWELQRCQCHLTPRFFFQIINC